MWKRISLLMCVCVLLVSCTPKAETPAEPVQEEEVVVAVPEPVQEVVEEEVAEPEPEVRKAPAVLDMEIEALMQEHLESPDFWTVELQKMAYDQYFWKEQYDEALAFREYLEANPPKNRYNPVFLCFERYPELIPLVFEVRPDLFLRDKRQPELEGSPFAYAVQNMSLPFVQFFFENDIPCLDVSDFDQFGSLNRGGSRFGIGGNILLFANSPEICDYLIEKGVPAYTKVASYEYRLNKDEVSVYDGPGADSQVVATLSPSTWIYPQQITAYNIDGCQWIQIRYEEEEGWVKDSDVDYSTGA